MRILSLVLLCLLLAACSPVTPAAPSVTPTVAAPSATPSSTQTATVTPTAQPTQTPVVCPTQFPLASVVIRAFLDMNKNGVWDATDLGMSWFRGRLVYATGVQEPVVVTVTSATGVVAVAVMPGTWQFLPDEWSPYECVVIGEYGNWLYANGGTYQVVNIPFNETCRPGTPTPTATPTPVLILPHVCREYATMCRPTCDGTFVVDPLGLCGSGFVCCVVAPTKVALASSQHTPTTVPGMIPTWQPTPEGKTGPCCARETPIAIAAVNSPCQRPYAEPLSLRCCDDETQIETCRPLRCCGDRL